MSKIHYANLPEVSNPTRLMQDAFYKLGQIHRYLSTAIKNAEKEVNKLGWLIIEKEKYDDSSVWIELIDPPSGEEVDGQIYQLFLRSKRVYETQDYFGSYITVLDKDFKNQQMKLNRIPTNDVLHVRPNRYDIAQYRKAVFKLQSVPVKENRPILRLLEAVKFVEWPEVSLIDEESLEWEYLMDEEIEGIEIQRRFVRKALSTPDFALLEGPPGSGKTTTICELILQIIKQGGKIMLCASTHVAIDNVLEKIKDHDEVVAVRIGDPEKISEKVVDIQIDNIMKTETQRLNRFLENQYQKTNSQEYLYNALKNEDSEEIIQNIILNSANLICGTSTGILQHPEIKGDLPRSKPLFDYLIIDEASKTTFVEFLVPALLASRWVLVGDPLQLSPYVDRGRIEGIIRTHLPYNDRRVCQTIFWANRHVNSLIQSTDEEFKDKLYHQANYFEEPVLDLEKLDEVSSVGIGLALLSSRIILGNKDELTKIQNYLPYDFAIAAVDDDLDIFLRRQKYWSEEQPDDFSEKNWESEITWRLIRAHEMRKFPEEVEKLEAQIKNLIPDYFEEKGQRMLIEDIYRTGFIALPSIIESLKEGFQFSKLRPIRFPSTLEQGLDPEVLEPRYEILTYQHRMHPDISTFPRKYIYKDLDTLKDPKNIERKRALPNIPYNSRSVWFDVSVKEKWKQYNPHEVLCVMEEFKRFIEWTKDYSKEDKKPWEIAIITFYKAQETELRNEIREFTGQKTNKFQFSVGTNILIRIGTVDSFQGREADVVFLSFSRNRKVGFLNSINRLNVAITRAKYLLLIVGDRDHFKRVKNGYLLNDLAREIPSTITWSVK